MNRQIRRLGVALMLLFGVLFVQLNRIQVVDAHRYDASPLNNRAIVRDFSRSRGAIISADGAVLAESVDSHDRFRFQRTYPERDLFGSVTGWFSFTLGSSGAERQFNDWLAGQNDILAARSIADLFSDRRHVGDVVLTIRKDLQALARDTLGNREGSAVVLDPRSGAILALYSWPSYDPNLLSTHNTKQAGDAKALYELNPAKPLLANSYQERYFPGSTFKLVTAAAGLDSGKVTVDAPSYPVTDSYTPPLTTRPIRNFGGEVCGGRLFEILKVSCNTSFAQMGVDLGASIMSGTADKFGFNQSVPLDLPNPATSHYPAASAFERDTPKLAQTAFGQNDVQATPLQMALVAAAIANGGEIMKPHVLSEIRDEKGVTLRRFSPSVWRRALSPGAASVLTQAMIGVVQGGTATRMQIAGVTVAAKTGTAQIKEGSNLANAWIVGFAPADHPRVVVAVMVKAQPGLSEATGGRVAAPIGQRLLAKALADVP